MFDIVCNVVVMFMMITSGSGCSRISNSAIIVMIISLSMIIISHNIMVVISCKRIISRISSCSCLNSHIVVIRGCIITVVNDSIITVDVSLLWMYH